MREKLAVFTAVVIFLTASGYLLWRESAFAHLKSGIFLYRKGDTSAIPIFKSGIEKNGQSYLLHNYLAKMLHIASLRGGHATPRGRVMILSARQHLNASLDMRRDTYDHLALAENYRLAGDDISGYAEYNISFFLSLNPEELERWHTPKIPAGKIAEQYFDKGEVTTAMVIAYNRLTGYEVKKLAQASRKPGAVVVENYFKGVSPGRWFDISDGAGKEEAAALLRAGFGNLSEDEKRPALIEFDNSGMTFLKKMVAGNGV
jgi:hypothetical protein